MWPFKNRVSSDLYKPSERLIYAYFDGERTVNADPMALYRRVMERGPEISTDIKVASMPMKDAPKAHANVLKKIREIFSLKPFEEGGLTELEALGLLDHFLLYANGIKKNSSPLPISSAPPPSPPSSLPTGDAQSTPNGSASGSVESGTSTASPPQSQPA